MNHRFKNRFKKIAYLFVLSQTVMKNFCILIHLISFVILCHSAPQFDNSDQGKAYKIISLLNNRPINNFQMVTFQVTSNLQKYVNGPNMVKKYVKLWQEWLEGGAV